MCMRWRFMSSFGFVARHLQASVCMCNVCLFPQNRCVHENGIKISLLKEFFDKDTKWCCIKYNQTECSYRRTDSSLCLVWSFLLLFIYTMDGKEGWCIAEKNVKYVNMETAPAPATETEWKTLKVNACNSKNKQNQLNLNKSTRHCWRM